MTSSLDTEIEINQEFLDFMQQKYKREHPNGEIILVSAPIFKKETRFEQIPYPDLLDELRVRKEPFFRIMYNWLYRDFGDEFETYQKIQSTKLNE